MRATLSLLGMQTGFKDLFPRDVRNDVSVTFIFSRIVVNARNELVLSRIVSNIAGPATLLYGPREDSKALPDATVDYDDPDPVELPDLPPQDLQDPYVSPVVPDRAEVALHAIHEYLEAGTIGPRATAIARQTLADGIRDQVILENLVGTLKSIHERSMQGRTSREAA